MHRSPAVVGASMYAFTGTRTPCRLSRNWTTATSQPNFPRDSVREPKSGVPRGPSCRRVRTSAIPVTRNPCTRWNLRTAATVFGPMIASIGPR
jgi:hypothetical protein